MPLIAGTGVIQKAYFGATEVTSIMNSGVNLLNGGGVFPGISDSGLYLPLTNTLVPTRGTSTPTFTRATAAWSFDNEGKLNLNVPSGCARFKGGRLVRNLVTGASETFNTSAWTAVVLTKQANSITSDASVNFQNLQQNAVNSYLTGRTIQFGVRVQYVSQQYVQLTFATAVMGSGQYCNFDLLNGIYDATGCVAGMVQVSPGVFDIWINPVATASASGGPFIVFTNSLTSARYEAFTGGAGKVIGLLRAWINNVSGQSDQTPSEYVSVGVLSSPYHGAGVDGCKWFPTNKDGSAIPSSTLEGYFAEPSRTNNCRFSRNLYGWTVSEAGGGSTPKSWVPSVTGSSLVTNGTFNTDLTGWTNYGSSTASVVSGKMRVDATGGNGGRYQDLTLTVGKTYYIAGDVTLVSGSGTIVGTIYNAAAFSPINKQTYLYASGSFGIIFKAVAATQRLYFSCVGSVVVDFDDIVVTECGCIPEQIAIGLDNVANSASRLTSAATDATITQLLTAATGTRTLSVYIKRVSGSGTISLTRNGGTNWTDITSSLVTGSWVLVQMTSDVGANPTVGIKMGTSGDVIDVDCVQDENGAWATSPILTTTAAVTRDGDVLSYASAFAVANGSAVCSVQSNVPISTSNAVALAGDANARLLYFTSATARSSGAAWDATNTATATGNSISTGVRKRATRWGTDLRMCADGTLGVATAFDGSMGASTTMYVGCNQAGADQISGNIGEVHIWNPTQLTDAQMQQVAS